MIPLKLETLLKGRVVEQDRVEYKRGWNPTDTVQTICAYANDFPNMYGGYIVVGVEFAKNTRTITTYDSKRDDREMWGQKGHILPIESMIISSTQMVRRQRHPCRDCRSLRIALDHSRNRS